MIDNMDRINNISQKIPLIFLGFWSIETKFKTNGLGENLAGADQARVKIICKMDVQNVSCSGKCYPIEEKCCTDLKGFSHRNFFFSVFIMLFSLKSYAKKRFTVWQNYFSIKSYSTFSAKMFKLHSFYIWYTVYLIWK